MADQAHTMPPAVTRSGSYEFPPSGMMVHTSSGATLPSDEIVMQPYTYISRIPGKGFRAKLIDAFNIWLTIPESESTQIKAVVDKLHNASLLIDDIEDSSKLRRGVPVAHCVYGVPATLNSANFVYFDALRMTLELKKPEAVEGFLVEMLELHRGQGLDIYFRDNFICPTEEEYVRMVLDKTGGLFRLGVRMMQGFSDNKADFMPLCNDLGLFYQVMDDYLNLQSSTYHKNKSFAEDLTEGKFAFPIVHAIRSDPSDSGLLAILRQRTTDVDLKKYAITLMERAGSFEYTFQFLTTVKARIDAEICRLGGNPMLQKMLDTWFANMTGSEEEKEEAAAKGPL